jgi:hypothetical protein
MASTLPSTFLNSLTRKCSSKWTSNKSIQSYKIGRADAAHAERSSRPQAEMNGEIHF